MCDSLKEGQENIGFLFDWFDHDIGSQANQRVCIFHPCKIIFRYSVLNVRMIIPMYIEIFGKFFTRKYEEKKRNEKILKTKKRRQNGHSPFPYSPSLFTLTPQSLFAERKIGTGRDVSYALICHRDVRELRKNIGETRKVGEKEGKEKEGIEVIRRLGNGKWEKQ